MKTKLNLKGIYTLTHRDKNGKILSVEKIKNLITNEGKDFVLDSALNAAATTDVTNVFYFAIFTSGAAAAGNTYATPGRTESSNYTEGLRQTWGQGASSGQSVTNAAVATITADTGGIVVTGIGVVCSITEQTGGVSGDIDFKGDTACTDGVLLSDNDVAKTLAVSETLDITYTIDA